MVFIASSSFLYTDTFGLSTLAFVGHLLIIVASFIVAWITAFVIFKVRRVEERWTALVESGSLSS